MARRTCRSANWGNRSFMTRRSTCQAGKRSTVTPLVPLSEKRSPGDEVDVGNVDLTALDLQHSRVVVVDVQELDPRLQVKGLPACQ